MAVLVSNGPMRPLLCSFVIVVAAGCSGGGGATVPRPLPTPPRLGPAERSSVARAEREIFTLTNRVRRQHRLPRFLSSSDYDGLARLHSWDMQRGGFVGHDSPTTGGPADRMASAKLPYRAVRENVAKAYSPAETVAGLMNSPGHRKNILSRDVTHLGVGVSIDGRSSPPALFTTQLFVRPGRRYDPRTAHRDALGIIQRVRRARGLRPLRLDPGLDRVARRCVKLSSSEASAEVGRALPGLGPRYKDVGMAEVKVSVLDGLDQVPAFLSRQHTHLGLGVRKEGGLIRLYLLFARMGR
jgi:uncharacterized protein YkwD